jgi:predicted nucleic-acid-binding protein
VVIALDTNICLRLVLDDDPEQTRIARHLVLSSQCFVPITVILEAEWVLRRVYCHSKPDVANMIGQLIQTDNIDVDRVDAVKNALQISARGAEFPDALHLALSGSSDWLATFDKKFVKSCADTQPPVRHP